MHRPLSVRRPVPLAEPRTVLGHLRALGRRRMPLARRRLITLVRRGPPQLNAIVPRPRRTRNTAARRAVHAIWLRRFHRGQSAKTRPRAASPRQTRRAKARLSTARSARAGSRARLRLRRCRMDLGRVRSRLRKGRRKMHLRPATMLSRLQQTGVLETIELPCLSTCRSERLYHWAVAQFVGRYLGVRVEHPKRPWLNLPCQFIVSRAHRSTAIPPASTTAGGPRRCAPRWRRPSSAQPGPPAACRV
jgi:hypothetical protein